jgi:UDP-glucose 4-epimerase
MLLALSRAGARVNLFNLGVDAYCEVKDSIAWIGAALGLEPRVIYSGGERGWVGDSPFIFLDTTRIRALGWQPTLGIEAGVRRTVAFLHENVWVLDSRS